MTGEPSVVNAHKNMLPIFPEGLKICKGFKVEIKTSCIFKSNLCVRLRTFWNKWSVFVKDTMVASIRGTRSVDFFSCNIDWLSAPALVFSLEQLLSPIYRVNKGNTDIERKGRKRECMCVCANGRGEHAILFFLRAVRWFQGWLEQQTI